MDWAHLVAFNLTLLAALVSPGPAMLVALRATLTGGRRTGIVTGLGLACMASAWLALALLGLDAVFTLFPWAYTLLKIAGAAYLIWIAVKMWRTASVALDDTAPRASGQQAFITGALTNLANPKSVLFAASVLVVIFPPTLTLLEKGLLAANQLIIETMAYTAFALALSTPPARAGYLRLKPVFDRIAASVLGALGVRLLLDRHIT